MAQLKILALFFGTVVLLLAGDARTPAGAACVTGVASNDWLNIRSQPGGHIIEGIAPNACDVSVDWNKCQGSWCYAYWRGSEGWVHTRYIAETRPQPRPYNSAERCAELRRLCYEQDSRWGCDQFRIAQC